MAGPLEKVRVLDMTWALAGPFCSMLLSDLGAEVIKVENPEGGDTSRKNFPFVKEVSSYFLSVNRGKKSVTVNLQHPRGEEILSAITRTRSTSEWVADMEKIDIARGPVNTVPQVAGDPHTLAREMITRVKHTQAGMLRVVNSPIKLSRTPVKLERASPVLGEHTEEVFMNLLGLSKEDLAKLREEKAI